VPVNLSLQGTIPVMQLTDSDITYWTHNLSTHNTWFVNL